MSDYNKALKKFIDKMKKRNEFIKTIEKEIIELNDDFMEMLKAL